MNSLGISIDIEDWYHIPPISGTPKSKFRNSVEFLKSWRGRYDYLTNVTLRTLDILDDFDITATIFVVADIVHNYPEIVDEIKDRGHEIGCHSLHHEAKLDPKTKTPRFTKEEFKKRVIMAKNILEKTFKTEVIGYRAPNAYVGGWMINILEEIGFRYDSSVSVNSFYNKTDSRLEGVETTPYFPEKGELKKGGGKRDILEIPFSYYNVLGVKIPTNGGPVMRFLGPTIVIKGLKQSLNRGPTVFYFHPLDILDEDFPYFSIFHRLFWSIKGKRVERYIHKIFDTLKKEDVEFVPLNVIAEKYLEGD